MYCACDFYICVVVTLLQLILHFDIVLDSVDESEDTLPATTNIAIQATLGESDASVSRNLGLEVSSSSIPPDQTRMIKNINTLISEVVLLFAYIGCLLHVQLKFFCPIEFNL